MSDKIAKHFFNPRNVGDAGEPCFTGRSGSPQCGATAQLSLQIDELHNISEARFRAAGCEVLVACLSLLTERLRARSTAEAANVAHVPEALIAELGADGTKTHCAQLACDAVVSAVRVYSNAARDEWQGEEALICSCFFVSERTIEGEIKTRGLTTVSEVTAACNVGGGCGSCQQLILEILENLTIEQFCNE